MTAAPLRTDIYYFSSTGNSLYSARRIARQIPDSTLYDIPSVIGSDLKTEAQRIIIVFPVYIWGLPDIIRRFLEKLEVPGSSRIYTVATNAGLAGDPHALAAKILKKKNLELTAAFLVWMPENFIFRYPSWPRWLQRISFHFADRKIDSVINAILSNRRAPRERSRFGTNWLLNIQHNFLATKLFVERSIHPSDYFWATDACNGCGICEKFCPVGNITMTESRPRWGDNCEVCVGCVQWCPKEAAQMRKSTIKRRRYHHPEVSLGDFL